MYAPQQAASEQHITKLTSQVYVLSINMHFGTFRLLCYLYRCSQSTLIELAQPLQSEGPEDCIWFTCTNQSSIKMAVPTYQVPGTKIYKCLATVPSAFSAKQTPSTNCLGIAKGEPMTRCGATFQIRFWQRHQELRMASGLQSYSQVSQCPTGIGCKSSRWCHLLLMIKLCVRLCNHSATICAKE